MPHKDAEREDFTFFAVVPNAAEQDETTFSDFDGDCAACRIDYDLIEKELRGDP